MPNLQNVIKEVHRIELVTLKVKKELKTLKNRVRAYKGWTKRYRKQQKELKQDNLAISKQRDQAVQELEIKQQCLLETVEQAKEAKESRDKALSQLDNVIAKIEQYREICIKANKIAYADKVYLIKEAEKLFFDEEILTMDVVEFDSASKPQMFEDQASIGRYLLDR
ncbi:MAG: hypothetical protein WBM44_29170 [Waterburya sp.]